MWQEKDDVPLLNTGAFFDVWLLLFFIDEYSAVHSGSPGRGARKNREIFPGPVSASFIFLRSLRLTDG
jgi:hypothetical protein